MNKFIHKNKDELIPIVLVWSSFFIITCIFFWILGDLLWNGLSHLTLDFLYTAPKYSGRAGGIGPILISTLLILAVCLIVSLPLGLGAAIALTEFVPHRGFFARTVRRSLDILSGVPSIVFGLFGNALFCKMMGLGFSILSGGLTLACMVLPLLIRSIEEGLRSVPKDYKLSATALGLSKTSILLKLLIPAATPGLIVGLVLSIGRALAETAALIFTSGYVDRIPTSLMDSGRSLSIHIFDLSMNISGGDAGAYKSSLVLVFLLIVINGIASYFANHFLRKRINTI